MSSTLAFAPAVDENTAGMRASRGVLRWISWIAAFAAGLVGLCFAAATSLLFGLWIAHFGKLSEPWLIAIGFGVLLLQATLYGFVFWRLIGRKWRFGLRGMLVATAIVAAGLSLLGTRLRQGLQTQRSVWQASQPGAKALNLRAIMQGAKATTWLERRFGYDPWNGVDSLRIQSDEGLGAVVDFRSGFDELRAVFLSPGVSDAGLRRAHELSLLPKLTIVEAASPTISDVGLKHLAQWKGMLSLILSGRNRITDAGLAELEGHSSLESLQIGNTIQISGKGLASIATLPRLKRLTLVDTSLTDADLAPLAEMTKLKSLKLWWNMNITDKGLEQLYGLSQLESLDITGRTNVTPAGIEALRRALPETKDYADVTKAAPGGNRNSGGP